MPEDCKEANKGFGVEPKKDCGKCHGSGFYYIKGWALTCFCKKRYALRT
jgi:hypothetical protein